MSTSGGNWGDLRTRIVSGIGMAAIAGAGLAQGGRAWAGLLLVIAAGMAVEWGMLLGAGIHGSATALLAVSVGAGLLAVVVGSPLAALAIVASGTAVLLAWTRRPLLALGAPCIAAAVAGMFWLRADGVAGLANALFIIVVVAGSDIGAYLTGRAIGGRKLAPTISPGKTVSGAIGGLAGAAIAASAVAAGAAQAGLDGHIWQAALLALPLAVVAQAGDLAESWLKRRVGAKDSSHLIPGHGGLLDRFDALMAVAPVAAVLAFTLGRGVVLWR